MNGVRKVNGMVRSGSFNEKSLCLRAIRQKRRKKLDLTGKGAQFKI